MAPATRGKDGRDKASAGLLTTTTSAGQLRMACSILYYLDDDLDDATRQRTPGWHSRRFAEEFNLQYWNDKKRTRRAFQHYSWRQIYDKMRSLIFKHNKLLRVKGDQEKPITLMDLIQQGSKALFPEEIRDLNYERNAPPLPPDWDKDHLKDTEQPAGMRSAENIVISDSNVLEQVESEEATDAREARCDQVVAESMAVGSMSREGKEHPVQHGRRRTVQKRLKSSKSILGKRKKDVHNAQKQTATPDTASTNAIDPKPRPNAFKMPHDTNLTSFETAVQLPDASIALLMEELYNRMTSLVHELCAAFNLKSSAHAVFDPHPSENLAEMYGLVVGKGGVEVKKQHIISNLNTSDLLKSLFGAFLFRVVTREVSQTFEDRIAIVQKAMGFIPKHTFNRLTTAPGKSFETYLRETYLANFEATLRERDEDEDCIATAERLSATYAIALQGHLQCQSKQDGDTRIGTMQASVIQLAPSSLEPIVRLALKFNDALLASTPKYHFSWPTTDTAFDGRTMDTVNGMEGKVAAAMFPGLAVERDGSSRWLYKCQVVADGLNKHDSIVPRPRRHA